MTGNYTQQNCNDEYEKQKKILKYINNNVYEKFKKYIQNVEDIYPLEWCLIFGKDEILKKLLELGSNPNSELFNGRSSLILAIQYFDIHHTIWKKILPYFNDVNQQDNHGNTILHKTMNCENCKVCDSFANKLIYEYGADPKIKNKYGISYYIYKNLSNNGAGNNHIGNDNVCNDEYNHQLQLLKSIDESAYKIYLENSKILYPLEWCYSINMYLNFRNMLRAGANINHKLDDNQTLWIKILNSIEYDECIGYDAYINLVLPYIDNINQQNKDGNTILHILALCGCKKCICIGTELVINNKTNFNIKNSNGITAGEIGNYYEDVSKLVVKKIPKIE